MTLQAITALKLQLHPMPIFQVIPILHLSSPERVVVDFAGMKFDGVGDTLSVNKAGVTSVRMGDNDEKSKSCCRYFKFKKIQY